MNVEELSKRVIIEKLPVTVAFIAKTGKISISKAAEILEEFYQKYKHEGLIAKYSSCQKGVNCDNKRPVDLAIKIEDKGDRIFSVQIDKSSLTNVLEACKKRWDPETMTACGMIQTITYETKSDLSENIQVEENSKPSVKVESKKNSTPSKPANTSEPVSRPVYTSRKAATAPSASISSNKPVYTSRKRGLEQPQPKEQPKKKQEVSKRARTEPSQPVSKELEELMEDDFTDDDDGEDKNGEDGVEEYKYDDIDVSAPDETKQDEVEEALEEESNEQTPNVIERIAKRDTKSESTQNQKQEDVADVETHVDADGYIVTKVNRKTPQPPPQQSTKKYNIDTKPKSSSAKPGTKQSTLASFFGKKK